MIMKFKTNTKTDLIIAPHADDDVLGCGGILHENCHVLYAGVDEEGIPNRPSRDARYAEIERVSESVGHSYQDAGLKVNRYELNSCISIIEKTINDLKPDRVFIPHPSYNQDHVTVYKASMVALRPHDKNFFVNKVLVYEQPHAFFWPTHGNDFKPNYYIPIDVERKVELYELMESQVRDFRSPDHLRALARIRGGQSNCKHAEAFNIVRWV